jgi:subtilisin family serine protease
MEGRADVRRLTHWKALPMLPPRRRKYAALTISSAVILSPGCVDEVIDDQRIATPEDRAVVNPAPVERDFAGQNARHRILLAAINTGVDYNHPLLLENIHFILDASGRPVRLGRDYVGEDEWPASYIARTSRYDVELAESERKASQVAFANASRLIRAFPDMVRFFHPSRNVTQEVASTSEHGTHVAGLMGYDRPEFGLLAYRVLPFNRLPGEEGGATPDSLPGFTRILLAAIEDAVADGARVVNLSLAVRAEATEPEAYERVIGYRREFQEAIARYPQVLFVAAAGNSGTLLEESVRVSYPCGAKAPNMLCVGALQESGELTAFTDIPASGLDVVFTLGEDVLSTVPVDLCSSAPINVLTQENVSDDELMRLAEVTRERCRTFNFLKRMSGTSMASPLVARVAAEILIEHPKLSAANVIQEIYRRSTPDHINDRPVFKLRIEKPSWYLLEQVPEGSEREEEGRVDAPSPSAPLSRTPRPGRNGLPEPGYWEAYLPNPPVAGRSGN